jgi:hypothetical protein
MDKNTGQKNNNNEEFGTKVVKLSSILRKTYCQKKNFYNKLFFNVDSDYGKYPMPKWDGGIGKDGKIHENIWEKIANLLLSNSIERVENCVEFMDFVFFKTSGQCYPTHLLNKELLEEYKTFYMSNKPVLPTIRLEDLAIWLKYLYSHIMLLDQNPRDIIDILKSSLITAKPLISQLSYDLINNIISNLGEGKLKFTPETFGILSLISNILELSLEYPSFLPLTKGAPNDHQDQ